MAEEIATFTFTGAPRVPVTDEGGDRGVEGHAD